MCGDCGGGPGAVQGSIAVGQVVGVAKEASLVALKVLDCEGSGTVPDVVAGAFPPPPPPPSEQRLHAGTPGHTDAHSASTPPYFASVSSANQHAQPHNV